MQGSIPYHPEKHPRSSLSGIRASLEGGFSNSLCYFNRSVIPCCFSIDLFVSESCIDRSIVSWFTSDKTKLFDQVLNQTFRILVDYVTVLIDQNFVKGSSVLNCSFCYRSVFID